MLKNYAALRGGLLETRVNNRPLCSLDLPTAKEGAETHTQCPQKNNDNESLNHKMRTLLRFTQYGNT